MFGDSNPSWVAAIAFAPANSLRTQRHSPVRLSFVPHRPHESAQQVPDRILSIGRPARRRHGEYHHGFRRAAPHETARCIPRRRAARSMLRGSERGRKERLPASLYPTQRIITAVYTLILKRYEDCRGRVANGYERHSTTDATERYPSRRPSLKFSRRGRNHPPGGSSTASRTGAPTRWSASDATYQIGAWATFPVGTR
jgi:hypothetical protein